ncbi:Eco57I restriction-modification methylase domain-containing protein [Candidatus Poriferisodalis sp.]|uniref:Eco57I restriction-modification methylase domain-containing protein n=1 Tax=Candidatus Poriferisodalis sp. TaxID=3101277 RepID=UPI003B01178F
MAGTMGGAGFANEGEAGVDDERTLCAAAWMFVRGGALAELSRAEASLVRASSEALPSGALERLETAIRAGGDPLGTALLRLRSAERRRSQGATYTPATLVQPMSEWLASFGQPGRVVDPGAGSGRFLCAVGPLLPEAELVAVELDPLAALSTRANLTALGLDRRSQVHVCDYRSLRLPSARGPTAFIGNPPYVRHHAIASEWKDWLRRRAADLDLKASALAGMHVYFLLATAHLARAGDYGVFVTSSEWLDVGYGRLARELVAGPLGGLSVHILDARTSAFADAMTTATVTAFEVGQQERPVRVRKVASADGLRGLRGGTPFGRAVLRSTQRWSSLLEPRVVVPREFVSLGEVCRVHRGTATGANATWVTDQDDPLLPASVLRAAVTKASELFALDSAALSDPSALRAVIDLPTDLDALDDESRALVNRFLEAARRAGVADGYIARHRRPWWSVKLRDPAPILATYMARRPPTFVHNLAEACNLNAVHGLHPVEPMSPAALCRLASVLRARASLTGGRTYAGGLAKFEPKEMEQIMVPPPSWLESDEPLASLVPSEDVVGGRAAARGGS